MAQTERKYDLTIALIPLVAMMLLLAIGYGKDKIKSRAPLAAAAAII